MRPEREGVIWALLTDEERAEISTTESREWYNVTHKVWQKDEPGGIQEFLAYRPKRKPKFRPWTPEEAIGKVVRSRDGGLRLVIRASGDVCVLACNDATKLDCLLSEFTRYDGSPCGVEVEE